MKTSKKILLAAAAILMAQAGVAQQVQSPDGMLKVDVSAINGTPSYSVMYGSDTVIRQSPLGLETSIADMSKNLKIASASDPKAVSETYQLPSGKKSSITYQANERVYTFASSQSGDPAFDLVMHVDNSNVAFKYVVHAQKSKANPLVSCIVNKEATTYTLPKGTTTFICPQMQPQTGFAQTAPSYETNYDFDDEMGKNGWGRGYTFPALFKETTASGSTIWVMLCETNVGGNYCGSRLESASSDSYKIAYPEDSEFGGVGTSAPGLMLRNTGNKYHQDIDDWGNSTPWRTITIGSTLAPIAETTIMWDLVKPQYEAKYDYKYGRSAWSWIIRMDSSCNFDEQKEYVDFAAAMGWEYLLVDAFWDTNIGHDRMEELSKYAQSKGVGLFLWYNSNGYWNNAFQSPRGFMHREITRRREMAWMQKAGIKGIKVDFVGSDKQQSMQMYEDILADANDYGIMVIFHGCTIPRGWERMYPNFVSCEAVRASENMAFSQLDNDIDSRSACIHPVLRNAIGNMDFGGSTLNKIYNKANSGRGSNRVTSDVFALATAILFQTPVQNFAMAPNNLTDAPGWAVDFMKKVPVKWADMKFIDGYPGKYIVMARKSAEGKWYIVAVNGDNKDKKPIEVAIPAGIFPAGTTVNVYSEDLPKSKVCESTPSGSLKQMKIAKKPAKITVPYNGGLVICQ